MFDEETVGILTDLARWDRPPPTMATRDNVPFIDEHISDWLAYQCPIRRTFCAAVVSSDGIYWTFPGWEAGKTLWRTSREGRLMSFGELSLIPAVINQQMHDYLATISRDWANPGTSEKDSCIALVNPKMVPVPMLGSVHFEQLPYDASQSSNFASARVLTSRIFNEIYGPRAFELSVRAARSRHAGRRNVKQWKKRKRGESPSVAV